MTPEQAIDRYARHGDAEAFALLVRRYQSLAYAAASRKLARREDAEDATQQAFLNLARAAQTVRRDVAAWLYRAAQHAAIDLIRRDATRRRHESAVDAAEPRESPDAAAWRELSGAIDDAIAALPDDERSLIVEHFLAGRSQADLAASLGVNQSTVSRRLADAVDRLREHLARRGHASLGAAAIAAHLPRLGESSVAPALAANLAKIGLAAPAKAAAGGSLATLAGLAVAAAALAAGVAGIAFLAGRSGAAPAGATATFKNAESALVALAQDYRLPAGEDIASFPPPFPAARAAYVDLKFPHANGSHNVSSVGFTVGPAGLSGRYMRYPDPDLKSTIEVFLDVPWHAYDAAALEPLGWRPGKSDWVVRDGLNVGQKLAALGRYVGVRTNKSITFERRMEKRPCVVHSGTSDRPTPKNSGNIGTAYVALDPPTPELLARLAAYDVPKGTRHAFQFDAASRWLDAPFFFAGPIDPQLDTRIFYVPATTQLSRGDADYRAKLQRVIDNVAGQLGGTWTIEEREAETWVAVVTDRAAKAPPREPDPAALGASLKLLAERYRVPEGEDAAFFAPPFSPERDEFVRAFVPDAAGRDVASVGLRWDGDAQQGVLSPQMASFAPVDAREWFAWAMVFDNVAAHAWNVDAIVDAGWRPRGVDVVLRDGLPVEARLRALATFAARDLGRAITFERRAEVRPCVVVTGDLRPPPADGAPRRASVADGATDSPAAHRIDDVCRWLDAPFVERTHRLNFERLDVPLPPGTRLDRRAAGYGGKLRAALDRLANQLGGTWTIEDREVETWVAVVAPNPP